MLSAKPGYGGGRQFSFETVRFSAGQSEPNPGISAKATKIGAAGRGGVEGTAAISPCSGQLHSSAGSASEGIGISELVF